jgi:hypothetical protein
LGVVVVTSTSKHKTRTGGAINLHLLASHVLSIAGDGTAALPLKAATVAADFCQMER